MAKIWAMPTWLFLHTLVAKIPEEKYPSLKQDLLYQVKNICAVLPCPDCAQHASQYMSGVQLKHVPTKEAFKTVLWRFHNTVNAKTGKPIFPLEKMDIYERCNLGVMYRVFISEFSKPSHNPKLMMDVMAREAVIAKFKAWMATV
jgi:hypothetical protein